jgi:hypothetical protein
VIAEFHRETAGGLDARIGQQTDHPDDFPLLQPEIQVGVRKTALAPMFLDDNVACLRCEFGMPLAAPSSFGEALQLA